MGGPAAGQALTGPVHDTRVHYVTRIGGRIWNFLSLSFLPLGWRVAVFVALGAAAGLGMAVARAANATSYLSNAPETCINCHVMNASYATWQRGSHGKVATCVDCHVPHDNLISAYSFKARDGLRHSYVFTLRREPQVLRLSKGAVPVVQTNCVRCHGNQLQMVRLAASTERTCWDCHNNFHGPVRSLSSAPLARRPPLPPAGLK
jgi:cytochrome c nitrite reductase small subunit